MCPKTVSSLSLGAMKVFQDTPTFFRHKLLLQHLALWCLKLPHVVSQGVSICVVKIFSKNKYMFGGFELFRLKVPQFPLPIYLQKMMLKTCHSLS